MNAPDWRSFALEPHIRAAPGSDGSRLVLWLPTERDDGFQYWERIANVARAPVVAEGGVCSTAATSYRVRQRSKGVLAKLWHRLVASRRARDMLLPDGTTGEQCGERRADLVLAWPEDMASTVDLDRLQARWPEAKQFTKLADRLYLASGVSVGGEAAVAPAADVEPPAGANPRQIAEQILAAARQSGDIAREAAALTDVGATLLTEGDAHGAISQLQLALALAQQLGDQARESDVIGNLGMAMLSSRQPVRARDLFEQELILARTRGDRFAEKFALERLGIASWTLRDFNRALAFFDQALLLTRRLGDRHQEATLLWHAGIQHAELGQRDLAIARADEAVTLFKLLGKPQASWYGAYLQKYRMGLTEDAPPATAAVADRSAAAMLGGSIVAGVMAGQPGEAAATAPRATSGPGLLRMALSATKAMAAFIGSGLKTVSPDAQRKRLQVCAACEHHTGVRCKICGCFTHVKSRMLHEDCPIGKWPEP
jgi:tetratricopeptide (TPR) repeat protein